MEESRRKQLSIGGTIFLIIVYLFMLGPVIIVLLNSFNSASVFPAPIQGFTLKWINELLGYSDFLVALRISAIVGIASAALACLLGIPASFTLSKRRFLGKDMLIAFFLSPLTIPQIVMGVATLQILTYFVLPVSIYVLIIVHVVFIVPFVIRTVMTSLANFDFCVEDASMTMGAGYLRTFFRITLPLTRAGISAGFLFAFLMSFTNVPLSLFLTTPSTETLPIKIFSYMETKLDPLVAAVGSLNLILVLIIIIFIDRVLKIKLM